MVTVLQTHGASNYNKFADLKCIRCSKFENLEQFKVPYRPLILVDPSTYHLYASPLELVGRPNEYDRSSRVVSDLHWGGLLGD